MKPSTRFCRTRHFQHMIALHDRLVITTYTTLDLPSSLFQPCTPWVSQAHTNDLLKHCKPETLLALVTSRPFNYPKLSVAVHGLGRVTDLFTSLSTWLAENTFLSHARLLERQI